MIARHLCPFTVGRPYTYADWCGELLGIFWLDLFDAASTATAMATKPFSGARPLNRNAVVHYRAAQDIACNSAVVVDRETGTVRRAPTPDLNSFARSGDYL
jgi:hypothetical protein